MKLYNLVKARKIISSKGQSHIPAKLAYKTMKFLKSTENDEAFYNSRIFEILESYGARDEKEVLIIRDGGIQIKQDKIAKCERDIRELGDTETDCHIKFNLADLDLLDLTMEEVFALEEIIEEE